MSSHLPQQRLQVPPEVDEEAFYSDDDGNPTLVTHADLEAAIPDVEKPHLEELDRYWVSKPYAFVVVYRNKRHNEYRYYVVEPRLRQFDQRMVDFFFDKLQTSMNYSSVDVNAVADKRAERIQDECINLMKRYGLLAPDENFDSSYWARIKVGGLNLVGKMANKVGTGDPEVVEDIEEDMPTPQSDYNEDDELLNSTQVQRIIYYLIRDFVGFERIDPIKHDPQIEDISCDGYNMPVFVYHTKYGEQMVTNIEYGEEDLDNFVQTLAQNAGKGISRRQPNIDATLKDGSRAQLTLGTEISDGGSNFTIRQFNDVPFTPVDLIKWQTYSIDMMVYLWLTIQNRQSCIFAGGTASGKTTSLNAVSMFMPSSTKIVSIEDTRELEIPQRNWVANMTRESFQAGDNKGTIDEYDLLEDALRKRPDYLLMGEVRGSEGQALFHLLSTGHCTYTTFHADSPKQVIRRFTTSPINVAPSMFDALDMIAIQETADLGGSKVRRCTELVEVGSYSAENNTFPLRQSYRWDQGTDEHIKRGESDILQEIKSNNNWTETEFRREMNRRRLVFAYLIEHGVNSYSHVAATIQAYMTSPDTVLSLMAQEELEEQLDELRDMKTVDINVDPEKETLIPRPTTPDDVSRKAKKILEEGEQLLVGYDDKEIDFAGAISDIVDDSDMERIDAGDQTVQQIGPLSTNESPLPSGETENGDMPGGTPIPDNTELESLFDEDGEEDDSTQMLITSETLSKLQGDGSEEPPEQTAVETTEGTETVEKDGPVSVSSEEDSDGDEMRASDGRDSGGSTADKELEGEPTDIDSLFGDDGGGEDAERSVEIPTEDDYEPSDDGTSIDEDEFEDGVFISGADLDNSPGDDEDEMAE